MYLNKNDGELLICLSGNPDFMNLFSFGINKCLLLLCAAVVTLGISFDVNAQDGVESLISEAVREEALSSGSTFTFIDFERFAPRNALDMLNRVPGFSVTNDDQGRGLGQASTNVLVNGKRLSSKSQNVFDQLRRVSVDNVEYIEIVDGATLDLPGLSGQVANVITRGGEISGRYEYRTTHRPKYAEPLWFAGELSVSGTSNNLDWNAAYSHGAGRGAAGGPGIISDANHIVTERREVLLQFTGEFPRLSGGLTWNGPNDTVANLNVQYNRNYQDNSNDEQRDVVNGVDSFRDFDNTGRGYGYEAGGDIEFSLGAGTLKLIALERFNRSKNSSETALSFADASPTTGSRFANQSETGERIGRAEYRWDMLGGNWEIDAEAAFNRFDRSSQFSNLDTSGTFARVELPNSSGEVTEDRYEMILTYGRTLMEGLSMQLGVGGENSELSQSGPGGLTRTFWRPKGSLSLAWTPNDDLDVSLNIARRVGQLSFGQFLSNVDLVLGNANAGNAELKPAQRWETRLQIKRNFGDWGSTNLQLYANHFDDYIDIIPLPGGGESQGNIDNAELYGLNSTNTINLDPMGWEGVRLDLNFTLEESRIKDPLTGVERDFSNQYDRRANINLRHDIPGTDWAWGMGVQYNHVQPSYRLSQVDRNYEGPTYTVAFIEHKDFYGLTANLQVFNMTDGRAVYYRTVYDGLRDGGAVSFHEHRDLSVQPIFNLRVTGNF